MASSPRPQNRRFWFTLSLLVLLSMPFTLSSGLTAQTFNVIYNFSAPNHDGGGVSGALLINSAGHLYGASRGGGSAGYGSVFELSPPALPGGRWTETELYAFRNRTDGSTPYGDIGMDSSGSLYGAAENAGSTLCLTGCGTIWRLSPPAIVGHPWTFHVLHRFTGGPADGAYPNSVTLDGKGNIYGMTYGGGASGNGSVFKVSPQGVSWSESLLYSFGLSPDLATPFNGALVLDHAGNLYGTSPKGGTANDGGVFQLTPPGTSGGLWSETILHSFAGGSDGIEPMGRLYLDSKGALWGTTWEAPGISDGTFFRLTPGSVSWTYEVLCQFSISVGDPLGDLVYNSSTGIFYGTAFYSSPLGDGSIFQLSESAATGAWSATPVYVFQGLSDGLFPTGLASDSSGDLYGISGGGTNQNGLAFKVIP